MFSLIDVLSAIVDSAGGDIRIGSRPRSDARRGLNHLIPILTFTLGPSFPISASQSDGAKPVWPAPLHVVNRAADQGGQINSQFLSSHVLIPAFRNSVGKNGTLAEALRLMNEALTPRRLSRNGPVNLEVSAALTRMDFGKDVTKIWQRLDEFITSDSRTESDKIVSEACAIADRLYNAQVGLAEAVYRREWNEEWAPLLSFIIPATRYAMTRAERMFLTKANWHLEWKCSTNAKENLAHDLANVYDWVMLPSSVGEKFYQDCFDENAAHEGIVFIVRSCECALEVDLESMKSMGIIRMPLNDPMMRATNGPV
ncbi:unnamed protein product, partial [Symbiodinium sp. CCMP2456]